ncbi:glutaredoxin family protein [Pararhodospirillum photometricum]|nr:glutaredoxin domain-containing protein [Pararhodospirillum photometricum]
MKVEIYTREGCVLCRRVKAWFAGHQIPFHEHDVTRGEDFSRMQERLPEARSIPQIVIGEHGIGGFETLMLYETPILERLREFYPLEG